MSSAFVQEQQILGQARGPLPAKAAASGDDPRGSTPPPARLTSAELRVLSAQWRMRAGEEPERAERVADVLDWLASQREADAHAAPALHRLRQRISGWMHL